MLGRPRNVWRLGALRISHHCGRDVCLCSKVFSFQPFTYSVALHCPTTGWVCQWKPFWIPVDDAFKKASVEVWVFLVNATSERSLSESQVDVIPETPEVSLPVSSSPWGPPKTQDTACSRERTETPLPPLQLRSTCERLQLPFSCDAMFVMLRGSRLLRIGSLYDVG